MFGETDLYRSQAKIMLEFMTLDSLIKFNDLTEEDILTILLDTWD